MPRDEEREGNSSTMDFMPRVFSEHRAVSFLCFLFYELLPVTGIISLNPHKTQRKADIAPRFTYEETEALRICSFPQVTQ